MNITLQHSRDVSPPIARWMLVIILTWMFVQDSASIASISKNSFFKNASEQGFVLLNPNKSNPVKETSKVAQFTFDPSAFDILEPGKALREFLSVSLLTRNSFLSCISINAP